MKRIVLPLVVILSSVVCLSAQKLGKPTLTSRSLTAAQMQSLNEGIALHDAKRYDDAIAKYRSIIAECSDCTYAIYELALSLNTKGEKLEAVETAYRGTKYISDELPLFYVLIANNLDDAGKPDDAVTIYRDGLKILSGDTKFKGYRASLNYNLGVTFVKQKKYGEARQALKSAIEDNPLSPSPHHLLAVVYNGTRYKVPAMLAAARLVSLEFNTQRTLNAAAIVAEALKAGAKDAKSGNMTINLDFTAPKDEGDYGMYEILLPTLTTAGDKKVGNRTSENEHFIEAMGAVIAMLGEDKKLKDTFVGKNYVPFATALKQNGHLDAFGNMVLFITNRGNAEAGKWINANEQKMRAFLEWAKVYRPAAN